MMDVKRAVETCNTYLRYHNEALRLLPYVDKALKKYDGKVINVNLQKALMKATGKIIKETNTYWGIIYDIMFTYTIDICILRASKLEDIADKNEKGNWRLNYSKASKRLEEARICIEKGIKNLEYTRDNYKDVATKLEELRNEAKKLEQTLHFCVR